MSKPDLPKLPSSGNPAGTEIDGSNNTSLNLYKKVPFGKQYLCTCSLCGLVGIEYIVKQYTNFCDILLEDRSTRIFDPFIERVPGY
jgi:hypothetical protein